MTRRRPHHPARRSTAGTSTPTSTLAVTLTVLVATGLSACGGGDTGVPDREPTVTGVAESSGEGAVLVEPSDPYYERMSLDLGDTLLVDRDGAALDPADVVTGDAVEVWVGEVCAESFPVQCDVEAVRVLD
ncbi:hypothetical protein [Cellulosimicrobium marinum]|uniref:hypothetical protein n=1 Tax=Cellulosimicrobium marinum TaxID=1638992 RepID=UPI001E4A1B41|nr:hypothetical protein [Cellulosimicrobium marinum]MCB7136972.1 hypothetical protein [Cellulosimicrobium marinum]